MENGVEDGVKGVSLTVKGVYVTTSTLPGRLWSAESTEA